MALPRIADKTPGAVYSIDNYFAPPPKPSDVIFGGLHKWEPAKAHMWSCQWDPTTHQELYRPCIINEFTPPEILTDFYTAQFRGQRKLIPYNRTYANDFSVRYVADEDWTILSRVWQTTINNITQPGTPTMEIDDLYHKWFTANYVDNRGSISFSMQFTKPRIIEVTSEKLTYIDGNRLKEVVVRYCYEKLGVKGISY